MNSLKKILQLFDFKTLLGKVRILLFAFSVTLFSLVLVLLYQNAKIEKSSKQVIEINQPVGAHATQILTGLNKVSSSERGYFQTQDSSYIAFVEVTWQKDIKPAINNLLILKSKLPDSTQEKIDLINGALDRYYREQRNSIIYFATLKNNLRNKNTGNFASESEALELLQEYAKQDKLRDDISDQMKTKSGPERKKIRDLLEPLEAEMQNSVKEELAILSESRTGANILIFMITLAGIFVSLVLGFNLYVSLKRSVDRPTKVLKELAQGKIPDKNYMNGDELDSILVSINSLSEKLQEASQFALGVGVGDYSRPLHSSGSEDLLSESLLNMRKQLIQIKTEEEERKWTAENLSSFGDIIRKNQSSPKELADHLLSHLAKELGALQLGLFVLSEDDSKKNYLEMLGCYAYDRKKFLMKRVEIGDGLLGQTYLEQKTTLLKKVPEGYMSIDSSLGQEDPRFLVLVPLMVNDICEGVLEVASFEELPKYKIEFIERLGESIASAVSNVRTNEQTRKLLMQSKEQEEMLKAQEEEMRQNMEEMVATQEEKERLQNDMALQLKAVNEVVLSLEFDAERKITKANDALCTLLSYDIQEVLGKSFEFLLIRDFDKDKYSRLWERLRKGMKQRIQEEWMNKKGEFLYVDSYFLPALEDGQLKRVVAISSNITETVLLKEETKNKIEDLELKEKVAKNAIDTAKAKEFNFQLLIDQLKAKEQKLEAELENCKESLERKVKTFEETLKQKDEEINQLKRGES